MTGDLCNTCGVGLYFPSGVCDHCDSKEIPDSFSRACSNDVTVHRMLEQGKTLAEIIGQLAEEKEKYLAVISRLELIAPRKLTLPDGRIFVWRCPDHLVP